MTFVASYKAKIAISADGYNYTELKASEVGFSVNGEIIDVTTLGGDGFRDKLQGLRSFSFNPTVLFESGDTSIDILRESIANQTNVYVRYDLDGTSFNRIFAIVSCESLEIPSNITEAVVHTFSMQGKGKPDLFLQSSAMYNYLQMGGVNQSGLEFGGTNASLVPGTLNTNYFTVLDRNTNFWLDDVGTKYIRIPFLADRMFDAVDGDIVPAYYNLVKAVVDNVLDNGGIPILDMHNYAKFAISGTRYSLGSAQYTVAHFVEHWRKLAEVGAFGYDETIEFDLMNEPDISVLTTYTWIDAVNDAIAAIRGEGADNVIHVEIGSSSGWKNSKNFIGTNGTFKDSRALSIENIVDSSDNFVLHVHGYFDVDGDGGNDLSTNSDNDSIRDLMLLIEYVRDLQRTTFPNLKIHIGETNGGDNAGAYLAMQNFVQLCYNNRDVVRSWTLWGGGAYWGNYELRTDPSFRNGDKTFYPMVDVIAQEKYFLGNTKPYTMYFDFANQAYSHTLSANFKCVRNTATAYAKNKAGTWLPFNANAFRITDRGLMVEDRAVNLVANNFYIGATETNVILDEYADNNDILDFLGGQTAIRLTESGVGDVTHRISITASSILAPSTSYVWQALVDFRSELFVFMEGQYPATARISSYYGRDVEQQSGKWKTHFVRFTRDTSASPGSPERCRIGFQPYDTLTANDTPDAYTLASPARYMDICCPMVTVGKRVQTPIFSASANAVREQDEIIFTGEALRLMRDSSFALVMEIASLQEVAEVCDFLSINGIVVLRKNADYTIGGDLLNTIYTDVPYNGISNFRSPRKVGIAIDKRNGLVHLGIEGLDIVSTSGVIPEIIDVAIEPFGSFLTHIKIDKGVHSASDLKNLIERA